MNFKVDPTPLFEKQVRKLSKKYPSIFSDLDELGDELAINPTQGKSLGGNFYKVRLAISSKGKGKSGGARLITFVKIIDEQA